MKVAVVGAAGRMGRAVLRESLGAGDIVISGCVESPGSPYVGRSLRELIGPELPPVAISDRWIDSMHGTEVLIDFSSPEGTERAIEMVREHHVPLVCGTTGFSEELAGKLRRLAETDPVFYAPNMSIGIYLTSVILREVAALLPEHWDAEMIEIHHTAKKDAPSGTALMLTEYLNEHRGKRSETSGRGTSIHSLRVGDLPGRHSIILAGRGETLEVTHAVHDRSPFASGAIAAARFMVGKPSGWYCMADMLVDKNSVTERKD